MENIQLAATVNRRCPESAAILSALACAISRFNSGMHEPQLVPALSCTPMAAAEFAPAAMASQIVARPTPKQAQTIGPVLASPSVDRPDSNIRR
jgi:hypothetical protein